MEFGKHQISIGKRLNVHEFGSARARGDRQAARRRPPGVAGGRLCARSAAGRASRRTSTSPPTPVRTALWICFPIPAAWARISAWCWCATSSTQVEVATFRSDHDYLDGRHPGAVHFESDPREDVLRRDFTINGLMMDPDTGEVLDYVGRARRSGARRHPRDRRPGRALPRRSSAAAARRPLRRAPRLRDRARRPSTRCARDHAADPARFRRSACATRWCAS